MAAAWRRQTFDRIEAGFRVWADFVYRRRWVVLVLCAAASGLLISFAPGLRIDNSAKSMLRAGDPARQRYDAFLEQFGQDHLVLIAIEAPDLFDLAFLRKLRDFHREIEATIPYVDEVTSLLNVRHTHGEGDELVVEDLMEDFPETQAEARSLRERVEGTPYYRDLLVDAELSLTGVLVEPLVYTTRGSDADALAGFEDDPLADTASDAVRESLSTAETTELVEAILALAERTNAPGFRIHVAGSTTANNRTAVVVLQDIQRFLGGTVVVIGLLLWLLFRRVSATVLPLLVVFVALFATFGVMALCDIPTSVSGQVLVPLLIAVGVCDALHLLVLVYRGLASGASRREALVDALGHAGLAVTMTSLTTAGGLLSFLSAELAQLVNLGIAAPIGIGIAYVLTMTLLPAAIAVLPLRARESSGAKRTDERLAFALVRVGDFATSHPRSVLVGTGLLTLVAATGLLQLRYSQDILRWFPEHEPLRRATERIDERLRGSTALELVLDTGQENGLHDPALLEAIDRAMQQAAAYEDEFLATGKVASFVDVLKETHRALNENRPDYYAIPKDRELVAQELLLFENSGSDDLEELVDTRFQKARVTIRTPSTDYIHYPRFIENMRAIFREALGPDIGLELTGSASLYARTFSVVNASMARSYVIAFLLITPLMVLMIGEWRTGLLAMIPNVLPVFLTLGLMGWLRIPVDSATLLVGCIIVGLAVDDTIHFMHRFQRSHAETRDVPAAVRETLASTGTALLYTSLVISLGFLVMILAYMNNTRAFGVLAAFATGVALLADVLLAPALLVAAQRRRGGEGRSP